MFAIVLGSFHTGFPITVSVLDMRPGSYHSSSALHAGDGEKVVILGYRDHKEEAEYLAQIIRDQPTIWHMVTGEEKRAHEITAENCTQILTNAEEHILAAIVAKELESIGPGTSWWDGISMIPKDKISDTLRRRAERAIFDQLMQNGEAAGMKNPFMQHAGNGHCSVIDQQPMIGQTTERPPWHEFAEYYFVHLPSEHGGKSSFSPAECSWPVLEVDIEEGGSYYLGIQRFYGKKQTVIVPIPIKTRGVACTMILGYEVIMFASRYPDRIDPLPCRLVEKVPFRTGFDPDKVTRL